MTNYKREIPAWVNEQSYAIDLARIDREVRSLNKRLAERMGLRRRATDARPEPQIDRATHER